METKPELLNEKQAAEILNLKPRTLQMWRTVGSKGPKFVKCEYSVRYLLSDILEYLKENTVDPRAEREAFNKRVGGGDAV
jgi:hypothetical protein